jgi:hypothetical protein
MNSSVTTKTYSDLQSENIELKKQVKHLQQIINDLLEEKQVVDTTPKYKSRHTDYENMSSPLMEELHDTTQIIRDAVYARQLSRTPDVLTIAEKLKRTKQIINDSIYAKKLEKGFM